MILNPIYLAFLNESKTHLILYSLNDSKIHLV